MKDLVSIIIPVYNVEKYVKRCINSVSNQTYKNIEIIVVNDGSTDSSADICDKCAIEDERIKIIKKQNEGAGYARNTGLDIAKGDYIFFVDSDDYILETCIDRLLSVAKTEKADIVKCSWIEGDDETYSKRPERRKFYVYSNVSAFRTRKMNIAVNGKLYKREVIGNLRYPKETVFDDEFFTYKLIYNAKKIVILDEAYYYYYMSPNSIMRGGKKKQPMQFVRAYEERILFFENHNEAELVGISHKEFAIRLMIAYLNRNKYIEFDESESSILQKYQSEYQLGIPYAIGIKEKLSLRVFNLFPKLTKQFINILT